MSIKIGEWKLIEFDKIKDFRGNLSVIEFGKHIDFQINRVYYLYDVPYGSERGGHAHLNLKQVLIPLAGSFTVEVSNGNIKENITLSNPNMGLYLNSMVWRELNSFTSGSVCLVLASNCYDESDYVRNFNDFIKIVTNK